MENRFTPQMRGRDLANHFRRQAAEPLRGNVAAAAVGEAGGMMSDLMLAVGKSGQFLLGWGVFPLVGKLPDSIGDHVEQAGVLLAEQCRELGLRMFRGGVDQGAGDGARSCGQRLEGAECCGVGPGHLRADRGPRDSPQALCVPAAERACCAELNSWSSCSGERWRFAGRCRGVGQEVQGVGNAVAPLPDRILGRAQRSGGKTAILITSPVTTPMAASLTRCVT